LKELRFEVKRTGFPVKIGDIELFFDCSMENLRRFFDAEEIAHKKLEEVQEKAKHIHFPDDEIDKTSKNTADEALDLHKEWIAIQYDIIFGEGTFKKIYKKYPDIASLEALLDPIGEGVADNIYAYVDTFEKERAKEVENIRKQYLNKKIDKK